MSMRKASCVSVAISFVAFAVMTTPAVAANAPAWNITAEANPTNFSPNSTGSLAGGERDAQRNAIRITVRNLGDTAIEGSVNPITVSVRLQLPAGSSIAEAEGLQCAGSSCSASYDGTLEPTGSRVYTVALDTGAAGTGVSAATVSGGEAGGMPVAAATVTQQLTVSSSLARFGLQQSSLLAEFVDKEEGPETQAGSHPYNLAVELAFATRAEINQLEKQSTTRSRTSRTSRSNCRPGLPATSCRWTSARHPSLGKGTVQRREPGRESRNRGHRAADGQQHPIRAVQPEAEQRSRQRTRVQCPPRRIRCFAHADGRANRRRLRLHQHVAEHPERLRGAVDGRSRRVGRAGRSRPRSTASACRVVRRD